MAVHRRSRHHDILTDVFNNGSDLVFFIFGPILSRLGQFSDGGVLKITRFEPIFGRILQKACEIPLLSYKCRGFCGSMPFFETFPVSDKAMSLEAF